MAGFYYNNTYPAPQQWQYSQQQQLLNQQRQPQQQPVYQNTAKQTVQPQVQQNQPKQTAATYDSARLPQNFQWLARPVKSAYAMPQVQIYSQTANQTPIAINQDMLASQIKATAGPDGSKVTKFPFKNDLKALMQNNQSVIEAIVIRTFGAKDKDKDGVIEHNQQESGTFLNAINRLDELKSMGINTLHVLPISEVGKINKLGEAGSIYAPADYIKIADELDTPNNGLSVRDEFKIFINECHKRGIRVMVDLPSCGSIDMTETNPDWFLRDREGTLKVPGTWHDIRMFDPYTNRDTGELRQGLYEMHKEFVRNLVDLGVDGIRADVARAKPAHFWKPLIEYSHQLDPEFAWLAESYIHEDASPMANIPADRPAELLNAGFDSFYGQYHILQSMKDAQEVHKYVIDNINMTHGLPKGKSMIGSFYTHDDLSVMNHGGALYAQFAAALVATLPMVNPYYINGFETGDPRQMDIFNYVKAPTGKDPQIFNSVTAINHLREKYVDVIGQGYYIPLQVKSNDKDNQIMAFLRHYNGKTLLVVANKDVNARHIGKIDVPTLPGTQNLQDLAPAYGAKSRLAVQEGSVAVDLAPGRVHIFEIDTPNVLGNVKDVYRQNL
jgi:glycosidase